MSFNNAFTAVTGATYTAAQYNTYTRDNLTAIWVYTTAGDIVYATSATTLARLGIGASGYIMGSSGSAPQWVANTKYILVPVNGDIALTVANQQGWFTIPPQFNGWNITFVRVTRDAGGTGVPSFQLRNITDGVNILSTAATIDSGEVSSLTAATPPVINTAVDDVATDDRFAVDVTVAGTNTLHSLFTVGLDKP